MKEAGGCDTSLAQSLGKDWNGNLSPVIYVIAIGPSFVKPWHAGCLHLGVAILWLVPDNPIERVVTE